MSNKIKVLIVDDHEMVRMGLKNYLELEDDIEVVGQANNGVDGIRMAKQLEPEVVLMDLVMEGTDGIEATKEIVSSFQKKKKEIKIIVLTSFLDEEKTIPVLEAGAFSYILKTSRAEDITLAIRKAINNESMIEGKVTGVMMSRLQKGNYKHSQLTSREKEVLVLIGAGQSNKEIAESLHIGIKTVKTHVSHILQKLELDDRTQAAIYAHKYDLI